MMARYFVLSAVVIALWALLAASFAMPVSAQISQTDINDSLCAGSNFDFTQDASGQCATAGTDATTKINDIIHSIVNILSVIVGVTAVIMIIIGGFRYITSGGNDASVTSAKNTILYAIIGLVVVALSQVIVRFVLSKLTTT